MATKIQKLGAYARLLRLSNAPTAVSNVWMGYAVVTGDLQPSWPLALASLVSLSIYHGGMVLNDANDAETDIVDGRGRPIEQGLISRRTAYVLASVLLGLPLVFGLIVLLVASRGVTAFWFAAIALILLVAAYDSRLKKTVIGPLLMALCRLMNVYLGVGAAGAEPVYGARTEFAFNGIVPYVLGLTCFARAEAYGKQRLPLINGLAISLVGLGVYAWLPMTYATEASGLVPEIVQRSAWWLIWASLALFATRGMFAAILQPTPKNIGRGVGIAIQGLIVIDAVLAAVYAGPMAGLAIFALLPVTMLLSKWIPQT